MAENEIGPDRAVGKRSFADVVRAYDLPLRTSDGRPSLAGVVADALRAGKCRATAAGAAAYLGVDLDEVRTELDRRKEAPAGTLRRVKPVRQFLQDASQGTRALARWRDELNPGAVDTWQELEYPEEDSRLDPLDQGDPTA
jgi:hypothetical protein